MKFLSLLFIITCFFTITTDAQTINFKQAAPAPPIPPNVANFQTAKYSSMAFADIDNDGDVDVLISGSNFYNIPITRLYFNDGLGNYQPTAGNPFTGVQFGSIAFADIDNDNDQDVLITGTNSATQRIAELYTNDGSGNYSIVSGTPFAGATNSSIAFADIDNDSDQDVLITGYDSSNQSSTKLYTNNNGNFTLVTSTPFEAVGASSIAFADIDNDNDQDVLITGFTNSSQYVSNLYTNDSLGNFTLVTGTSIDAVASSSVAFADVDNDNDQDLVISGFDSSRQTICKLYLNDSLGNYSLVSGTPFTGVRSSSIAFTDIDNDNDVDLLITGITSQNVRITKLYTNNSNGVYSLVTGTPFPGVYVGAIGFTDVDNDNDSDLIITGFNNNNRSIAQLYINDGIGTYAHAVGTSFDGVEYSSVAFTDIDNDNDQDLLITGEDSSSNRNAKLFSNDGTGKYTLVTGTSFDGVAYGSIAFADIDNDNDQDVLITGFNNLNQSIAKLYTNDGLGNYTLVLGTPFTGVVNSSIAFADVDNDNDQDILITGRDMTFVSNTKLYLNNGLGAFTLVTGTPFDGVESGSVAFADIDNDNDQDVLITGYNNVNQRSAKLYTNDGSGNYTLLSGTPFIEVSVSSIAFADIDNDNDQDVLITGSSSNGGTTTKLYNNNGFGVYTLVSGTPFEDVRSGSIAFDDMDGDNDLDVMITGITNSNQFVSSVYTNDGLGNFIPTTGIPFDKVGYGSIAFADIDNDNDRDVVITGRSEIIYPVAKLYKNVSCKLSGSTQVDSICSGNSYVWTQNNTTYSHAGIYRDTVINSAGCDSIITLDLKIDTSKPVVTRVGLDLMANSNQAGTLYQWLDCLNNYTPIQGETSQVYSVSQNGEYAVEVTFNNCIDTSACTTILNVGLMDKNQEKSMFTIYPNPTKNRIMVTVNDIENDLLFYDLSGNLVKEVSLTRKKQHVETSGMPTGIYVVKYGTNVKKLSIIK